MPLGDGRGPWGLGPGTGRGRGPCGFGMARRNALKIPFGGRGWIAGIAASLLAAAVRDLASPTGFLRQAAIAFFPKKQSRDVRRVGREADFTVLDERSLPSGRKKEA